MLDIKVARVKTQEQLLCTDAQIFTLSPGGLYWLVIPEDTSDEEMQEIVNAFPGDDVVLSPPATILLARGHIDYAQTSIEDLTKIINNCHAAMDQRS